MTVTIDSEQDDIIYCKSLDGQCQCAAYLMDLELAEVMSIIVGCKFYYIQNIAHGIQCYVAPNL